MALRWDLGQIVVTDRACSSVGEDAKTGEEDEEGSQRLLIRVSGVKASRSELQPKTRSKSETDRGVVKESKDSNSEDRQSCQKEAVDGHRSPTDAIRQEGRHEDRDHLHTREDDSDSERILW